MKPWKMRRLLGLWGLCLFFLPAIGWADQPGAHLLCKAAEKIIDSGKQLDSPPTTQVDDKVIDGVLPANWQPGWNSSPTQVAHVVVDGRPMAAIIVDSGGTSHDTLVYLLSDDLKTLLSPADRNNHDAENDGSDDWGFGVNEDVVIVAGQPMVRSWDSRGGGTYLSTIEKDGDIVPTCMMKREALKTREIAFSTNASVCHAVLAGKQLLVPMHPPASGQSLNLKDVPTNFSRDRDGSSGSTDTELKYQDTAMAADVSYTLVKTGVADIDNNGHKRHVGMVTFWEGNSTAGDGTYTDSQVLPVYLDRDGVADLSAEANEKLAAALPHRMRSGKLVTLNGTTYLELSPYTKGPSTEVWKIGPSGAHQVCGFQFWRTVVQPTSR